MSYHERTDLGAGTEHEFTLSVGVVELTWQLVGKVIRPARGLVQETFTITSAEKKKTYRYQHISSRTTLVSWFLPLGFYYHKSFVVILHQLSMDNTNAVFLISPGI